VHALAHVIRGQADVDRDLSGLKGACLVQLGDLLRPRDLSTTGSYVPRDMALLRTLSEMVGQRIATAWLAKTATVLRLVQPLPCQLNRLSVPAQAQKG
jgi:hypothetical protein